MAEYGYSESDFAIASLLLLHLRLFKDDCAACMDYTTDAENCLPVSPVCASNRQMSQHHPNKQCIPQTISVLLCFSKQSSTAFRIMRSGIFVSSSGNFPFTYSNVTNVLAFKGNECLGKILQLVFYKLPFLSNVHNLLQRAYTQLWLFLAESLTLKTSQSSMRSSSSSTSSTRWESANAFCIPPTIKIFVWMLLVFTVFPELLNHSVKRFIKWCFTLQCQNAQCSLNCCSPLSDSYGLQC